MKKYAGKILLILLAVVLIAVLAACNDNTTGTNGTQGGGDDPTPATHTVHFDANGGDDIGTAFDVTVTHGGTVNTPMRGGEPYVPHYTGHEFAGWCLNDTDTEFVFADNTEGKTPTVINNNVTIKASWTAKTYTHTLVTSANAEDHPYLGDATKYGVWECGSAVSLDDGASFVTRYNSDEAVGNIPVVEVETAEDETAEDDWMVYWYYVTLEKDEDGNEVLVEVPFTTSRAGKDDTDSLELIENYTHTDPLVLYPKMHSQLPVYTLKYGDGVLGEFRLGDTVNADSLDTPTRDGYVFDGWYFTVTTGEGEDKETKEYELVLLSVTEDEDNSESATVLSETIATEAKEDGTFSLTVYAKWVRTVSIGNEDEYKTFAGELNAALTGEDENEKHAYLNAQITLTASFALTDCAPLYTEEQPFAGTLDGGGNTVTVTYTGYTGDVYAFIGASTGSISDLTVNITVNAVNAEGNTVYIGAVGVAGGTMENVTASLTVRTGENGAVAATGKTVYVGALAARLGGGTLTSCTVTSAEVSLTGAADVYAGGAVGYVKTLTATGVIVENAVLAVEEAGDAFVGGMFGNAEAPSVTESGVKGAAVTADAKTVYAGGFAGRTHWGNYKTCFVDATVTVSAEGAYVGGFAGQNSTLIANCRAGADITVNAVGSGSFLVGGIAGDAKRVSTSSSTTSSATGDINASFGGGSITVNAGDHAATVYAGGVAGRISHFRSDRSFADVDITVTGGAVKASAGAFAGSIGNSVTLSKSYYASDSQVTVNGEDRAQAKHDSLTGVEGEKFADESWITGSSSLNLDGSVWTVKDGSPCLEIELPEEAPEEGGESEEA